MKTATAPEFNSLSLCIMRFKADIFDSEIPKSTTISLVEMILKSIAENMRENIVRNTTIINVNVEIELEAE